MKENESNTCTSLGGQWEGEKKERYGEGDGGKEESLIFHICIPDCQLM